MKKARHRTWHKRESEGREFVYFLLLSWRTLGWRPRKPGRVCVWEGAPGHVGHGRIHLTEYESTDSLDQVTVLPIQNTEFQHKKKEKE